MVGEVIAGRYELEELVGTGGMSSVYRARDAMLEREVALKILHAQFGADPAYVDRFRREARAAAQLSHHPNIVTVIDRGEQDGRQFIVFEYVEGETLKEILGRGGPLPIRDVLEIGIQVARALAFAHEHGLVHRDVKPQNVLLNGDRLAKVTDFGIARSLEAKGMTQTGTVLGTSDYISPEQARGEVADEKSDIYSLGCLLYELLAGEPPFPGESFMAVALRLVNEPAPSVLERRPDTPARLALAIARCLEKDPRARFQTMDELVAELEACLAALGDAGGEPTLIVPSPVVRESGVRRERAGRRMWPVLLLLLGLAGIGAIVAGAFFLRSSDDKQTSPAPPPPAKPKPVALRGAGAWDPLGDGTEHGDEASLATDGDRTTAWSTETYDDFSATKAGVGLVLDAGKPVALRTLTVTTDTPGLTARIRAGDGPSGPFRFVSGPETATTGTARFVVKGPEARYYVVWITRLAGSSGDVNEVKATA